MIAPLIKWDHGTEWTVPGESGRERSREREIVIDVNDIEYEYMKGHIIDGESLLSHQSPHSAIHNFSSFPQIGACCRPWAIYIRCANHCCA